MKQEIEYYWIRGVYFIDYDVFKGFLEVINIIVFQFQRYVIVVVIFKKIIINYFVNFNYGILFEIVIFVFLIGLLVVYFICKWCLFELKVCQIVCFRNQDDNNI